MHILCHCCFTEVKTRSALSYKWGGTGGNSGQYGRRGETETGRGDGGKRESNEGGGRQSPTYKQKEVFRRVEMATKIGSAQVYDVLPMDHCHSSPYKGISFLLLIHLLPLAFAWLMV